MRLAGCTSCEFVLPVWSDQEEADQHKALSMDITAGRIKRTGLAAFSKEHNDEAPQDQLAFLECTVVPEMPILWMRSTSLTHGALMLYDGEMQVGVWWPATIVC